MPFPLAHPAAALPLRRYCPRYLNLPALMLGSLTPDAGYAFGHLRVDSFSHGLWPGSFVFCLPAGLVMFGLFYAFRRPVVGVLPRFYRQACAPLCQRPFGSPVGVLLSLLIGAWTHIVLDDITYRDGRMMQHLPILQGIVIAVGNHRFGIYDLLYAGCTFGGVAWLGFCYLQWLERVEGFPERTGRGLKLGCALSLGGVVLCVATASRGNGHSLGMTGVAVSSSALLIGFLVGAEALRLAKQRQNQQKVTAEHPKYAETRPGGNE